MNPETSDNIHSCIFYFLFCSRRQHDEISSPVTGAEVEFIFIRLCVLREYLEKELAMTGLPFKQDIEVSGLLGQGMELYQKAIRVIQ